MKPGLFNIAILALTSALTLCAGAINADAASPGVAEITMWDVPESTPYTAWWRAHVESFNKAHPDIHVSLEVFETEAYRSKIASALVAGTTADIFYLPAGPQGFQAFRDGQARSLDGLLDAKKFTGTSMAACTIDGKLVCMPLYIAPNLLYYNKAMFKKANVDVSAWKNPMQPTWDEFMTACKALKEAGLVPIALGNADGWPGTMYLWILQNRYGGIDDLATALKGSDGKTYSTIPSFQKAAAKVAEIGQSGYLPLGYNGIGGGQKYTLFTSSQAAIIFQGTWVLGRIASNAPKGFEYGFFNFPTLPDGLASSQQDMVGGFDAMFVSAKTAHADAVASFLNSFAEKDVAISFMKDTQNISVIKDALASTGPSDGMLGQVAAAVAAAPHITPWWDNYFPAPVFEESTRAIQGLFDGSISPSAYLAGLDKAAGH